jgi:uncharacterized protein YfaS (alpha-2-macroglobulin family)
MSEYYQGETVSKAFEFTDKDGNYVDPETTSVEIIDASGTVVATPTLTKTGTGKYELNYNLAADAAKGLWKIFIEAMISSWYRKAQILFEVKEVPP